MINHLDHPGYTLLEAMISIIIIGILSLLSFPSMQHLANRGHDQLLQANILNTIHTAQIEAEVRGLPISVCFSNASLWCGGASTNRLLVFIDESGKGVLHDKQQLLANTQINLHKGRIMWRAYPRYRDFIHILPTHWLSADNGMFWYCRLSQKQPVFAIAVNKSGGSRVIYPVDGEIKDSRGRVLHC